MYYAIFTTNDRLNPSLDKSHANLGTLKGACQNVLGERQNVDDQYEIHQAATAKDCTPDTYIFLVAWDMTGRDITTIPIEREE